MQMEPNTILSRGGNHRLRKQIG